jgi:hypothetical protein
MTYYAKFTMHTYCQKKFISRKHLKLNKPQSPLPTERLPAFIAGDNVNKIKNKEISISKRVG